MTRPTQRSTHRLAALSALAAAVFTATLASGVAVAQTTAPAPAAATAADDRAEGEVRRVDKANGRIQLRHGEIKSLDMPPMTMMFQVRDKDALDRLKAGDKIRFKAVKEGSSYVVTELEVMP